MANWSHENISVDSIKINDVTEFVVEIRGERFILSEREADALMGEISIYGGKNPNRRRYDKINRSDERR